MDLTPEQQRTRERFEALIGLAAPVFDLILGVGERVSRIAEPTDHEYYPVRAPDADALPRRVRPRSAAKRGPAQRSSGGGGA